MSFTVLGVSGCKLGLDVFGKSGQIDASSSAMKVDCDGDVVNESGSCRWLMAADFNGLCCVDVIICDV